MRRSILFSFVFLCTVRAQQQFDQNSFNQLFAMPTVPPSTADEYSSGSILQASGGGIKRTDNNEYYSTYNAYNNPAAYPREFQGAVSGFPSFNPSTGQFSPGTGQFSPGTGQFSPSTSQFSGSNTVFQPPQIPSFPSPSFPSASFPSPSFPSPQNIFNGANTGFPSFNANNAFQPFRPGR